MLVFGGVDGRILTKSWSILDLSLDHPCFFQTSEREFLRVVLSHLEGERQTPTKKTSCNNPSACFIRPNPGLTSLKENTPSKQGRNSNQNTGQVGFSYIPHLKEEGQSVKHPICGSLALLLMFLSKSRVIYHWCKKTGRLLMGWTTNLKWWSPNFLEPATVSSVVFWNLVFCSGNSNEVSFETANPGKFLEIPGNHVAEDISLGHDFQLCFIFKHILGGRGIILPSYAKIIIKLLTRIPLNQPGLNGKQGCFCFCFFSFGIGSHHMGWMSEPGSGIAHEKSFEDWLVPLWRTTLLWTFCRCGSNSATCI